MRRRILRVIIAVPLALIVVGAGTALAVPTVRNIISGIWNRPDRLPALADNPLVHYEPGAEDYAHEVADLLPAAIARIEAAHGRPFAHPVTIGVYATPEAFAAANCTGSNGPVGTSCWGRVVLSPKLHWPQRRRLPLILTHELSHAHIQGWMGAGAYVHLPNWFKEGLAEMVSGGGGSELVSEKQAWDAIQRGEHIDIDEAGSLLNLSDIRYEKAPEKQDPSWYPIVMAYRQSMMFVSYLHESDGPAFDRMMKAVLDGSSFADAVRGGYHDDVRSLWQKFVASGGNRS